jgi:glutathione S-transferase
MILLFQIENCQYCSYVRSVLANLNISYVAINAAYGSPARQIQLKLGSPDQVPFLVDVDKGRMISESEDIVEYLSKTYA